MSFEQSLDGVPTCGTPTVSRSGLATTTADAADVDGGVVGMLTMGTAAGYVVGGAGGSGLVASWLLELGLALRLRTALWCRHELMFSIG